MKIRELISQGVAKRDAKMCGRAAELLRFTMGRNYHESFAYVQDVVGDSITLAEWDELLRESEDE